MVNTLMGLLAVTVLAAVALIMLVFLAGIAGVLMMELVNWIREERSSGHGEKRDA